MGTFNYILPLLLKNWLTNPDGDEQDRVVDGASEREEAVDRGSVRGVGEDAADEADFATKCKEDKEADTQWIHFEGAATERKDIKDAATEGKDTEDGATERRDIDNEVTEWKDIVDGATNRKDNKDGSGKRPDIEDVATEKRDLVDGATKSKNVDNEAPECKGVEEGATERRDASADWKELVDDATECEEAEDEAIEWEDAAAELKTVEDDHTKYEEFEVNATISRSVEGEEPVFEEIYKKGQLICKRVTDRNGFKTPKGQRAWKPFNAVLQGVILYLQKDTHDLSKTDHAIRVHHALAYAVDYKQRPHVLCLKTADLRTFFFQAESEEEQASWIVTFNYIAGFNCFKCKAKECEDGDKATEWTKVMEEVEAMGMDPIHKIGHLICKRVTNENETKARKGQRAWKPFNVVLQGMILYLKADTQGLSKTDNAIRVHHALAYPIDYKKKPHVLCLRTADQRHFFFQADSEEERTSWVATINCIAACYSAPPHIPVSHDKTAHCPQFLPSFSTQLSLEQQLECYSYQFLKVSKHLAYYNSLPYKDSSSLGYMLQEVKRYEAYVRELQKLVAAKDAGEGCSDSVTGPLPPTNRISFN